jgi:Ser/Thr protein kinase RdoA (MazF antagonist)
LHFFAESFNTVFRATSGAGDHYALRVGPRERIHPEGTEVTEVTWMAALGEDGACPIPRAYEADDGSLVLRQSHPGVPGERMCVLFDWIAGRPLADQMDTDLARRAGRLSAVLHGHAAASGPATAPLVPVADRVLYWLVEDRLSELTPTYGSLFLEARDRAQQTVDSLWRHPPHRPHLIHGDLVPSNVIVSGARLTPIDFQDLVWGFEVQDIAITLSSLHRFAEATTLVDAFRSGYRAVRRWEDSDPALLAALTAGRRLHQLNLGLNLRKPGLTEFVGRAGTFIRGWMDPADPPA